MKPYSLDFRKKIVETYKNQEGSIRAVARRFKVAKSFVQKLLKRYEEEQTLEPKPHGGGGVAKLADHLELVKKLIEEKNDASLQQLCQELKSRKGVTVSQSTLSRFLKKHKIPRKKQLSTRTKPKAKPNKR